MSVVGSTLAVASAAVGVGLLRVSWSRRADGSWLTLAGWTAFLVGALAWHGAGLGWDEAVALALLAPSLVAFVTLGYEAGWGEAAASLTRAGRGAGAGRVGAETGRGATADAVRVGVERNRRTRHADAKHLPLKDKASVLLKGTARLMLAGPLALGAALGLAALVALRTPWVAGDRLVTAAFLLPIAWAAGAIWATMDSKPVRVAVALSLAAILCTGGAVV